MSNNGLHSQFRRFLVNNLCHKIAEDEDGKEIKLWEAYKEFSELKWNDNSTDSCCVILKKHHHYHLDGYHYKWRK